MYYAIYAMYKARTDLSVHEMKFAFQIDLPSCQVTSFFWSTPCLFLHSSFLGRKIRCLPISFYLSGTRTIYFTTFSNVSYKLPPDPWQAIGKVLRMQIFFSKYFFFDQRQLGGSLIFNKGSDLINVKVEGFSERHDSHWSMKRPLQRSFKKVKQNILR